MGQMKVAIEVKITQHPEVKTALIATSPRKLLYVSDEDAFWGYSLKEGRGLNTLGQCLESVRSQLIA